MHEIFQYEGTDAGEDVKQSLCLGNFSPIFHDLVFGVLPRYSRYFMRSWEEWDDKLVGSGTLQMASFRICPPDFTTLCFQSKILDVSYLSLKYLWGTFFPPPLLACLPSSFLPPSVLPSFHGKGNVVCHQAMSPCSDQMYALRGSVWRKQETFGALDTGPR